MPKKKSPSKKPPTQKVQIHYIKTNQFRNIFVSGAYGGAAKEVGRIYMSVFSDRMPIPQITINTVNEGAIGIEIPEEKSSKEGVIRDVEANLIFDLQTAKALIGWLQHKIGILEGDK